MTLIPEIDTFACVAHGDCAVVAPEAFRVDDVAVVIGTAPEDRLREAARACPARRDRRRDGEEVDRADVAALAARAEVAESGSYAATRWRLSTDPPFLPSAVDVRRASGGAAGARRRSRRRSRTPPPRRRS